MLVRVLGRLQGLLSLHQGQGSAEHFNEAWRLAREAMAEGDPRLPAQHPLRRRIAAL